MYLIAHGVCCVCGCLGILFSKEKTIDLYSRGNLPSEDAQSTDIK